MARPNSPDQVWLAEVVDLMVRTGISLRQAATELEIPITTSDAENIQRRKSFQKLLRTTKSKLYIELGSDPDVTKIALIGKLLLLSDKLMEEGEWDKASEVLFKCAKIRGDVGVEVATNVFTGLSAKDYSDIRKNLEEGKKSNERDNAVN
jgi:hypothetical protein